MARSRSRSYSATGSSSGSYSSSPSRERSHSPRRRSRSPRSRSPRRRSPSPRRRRPATCEACCARGWTTACAGASDWWLHLKLGAATGVKIAGQGRRWTSRGDLRRCPRLTAGVHHLIVQHLVVVRQQRACRGCRAGLADQCRNVAGGAGGVQGGGNSLQCRRHFHCDLYGGRRGLVKSSYCVTHLLVGRAFVCLLLEFGS